jgi:CRP-like cAMP-binding protein
MVQIEGLDRLLEEHPFFKGLDEAVRQVVAGCAANERYDAGAYVFREGEPADKFYLIRHGAVALELHTPGREPIVVDTVDDGEILGWSWIVPPYRWAFDARVVQLTRAVSLDAKCLRTKMEADPALGFELLKRVIPVMAQRLAHTRLQLIDMYGEPARRPAAGMARPEKKARKAGK